VSGRLDDEKDSSGEIDAIERRVEEKAEEVFS